MVSIDRTDISPFTRCIPAMSSPEQIGTVNVLSNYYLITYVYPYENWTWSLNNKVNFNYLTVVTEAIYLKYWLSENSSFFFCLLPCYFSRLLSSPYLFGDDLLFLVRNMCCYNEYREHSNSDIHLSPSWYLNIQMLTLQFRNRRKKKFIQSSQEEALIINGITETNNLSALSQLYLCKFLMHCVIIWLAWMQNIRKPFSGSFHSQNFPFSEWKLGHKRLPVMFLEHNMV